MAEYFTAAQLTSNMVQGDSLMEGGEHVPFVKGPVDKKKFYEFKMIEIKSSGLIVDHYAFIHPRYEE